LLHFFNISREQYDKMLADQGGVCALCRLPERKEGIRHLSVDHDRRCCPGRKSCGRCVRGALCFGCNWLVGRIESAPGVMLRLSGYLGQRPFEGVI
jgi:hypothetical protein